MNREEAIEKINRYLTERFLGQAEDFPADECETEAKAILDMLGWTPVEGEPLCGIRKARQHGRREVAEWLERDMSEYEEVRDEIFTITEDNRDAVLLTEMEQERAITRHLETISIRGTFVLSKETIRWASYDALCAAQHEKSLHRVLSHPRVAVLSEDQKHPSSPWPSGCDLAAGFIRGTTTMWLDGFRRIEEKPV